MPENKGSKNLVLFVGLWLMILGAAGVWYKFYGPGRTGGGGSWGSVSWNGNFEGMKSGETLEVPFILWGGDVATFVANGGMETKPDSIFAQQKLNLKLVPGDDFDGQVKNYLSGKSPFLRGTMSMLGQVSDELTKSQETQPVVFLQLTWSAGDHMVARANCKTLDDLKGKKIALQKGGPHVGMLNDILRTARIDWKDIEVIWTEDVTGDKGPASLFRKNRTIDACFAVTPDMTELTGGLEGTGTGDGQSVKGAHVLVSTAQMSRSIADVYACRRDFFEKNKLLVEAFVVGWLKGCEELVETKKKGDLKGQDEAAKKKYKEIIKLTQSIYSQDKNNAAAVEKEDDVDGLISDATFVGLPGNISFFTDKGNLSGFKPKLDAAMILPADPAKEPLKPGKPETFLTAMFDYNRVRDLGKLTGHASGQPRFSAELKVETEKTIYFFTISFEPNDDKFDESRYGEDFRRALEQASLFGNAVVAVRGHADPGNLVGGFLKGAKGLFKNGGAPDPNKDIKKIIDVINQNPNLTGPLENGRGGFENARLKEVLDNLQGLSERRAATVRKKVVDYAGSRSLVLDQSQIRSVGVGVTEPVVGFPQNAADFAKNRRVEFRIIKVPDDAVTKGDFDF